LIFWSFVREYFLKADAKMDRQNYLKAASWVCIFYGKIFVGIFILLAGLSLFGNDHPWAFFFSFLVTGAAYVFTGYRMQRVNQATLLTVISLALVSVFLLVKLYAFSTANPVTPFVLILRILICLPPVVFIFLGKTNDRHKND
jgi:hypothetical protein